MTYYVSSGKLNLTKPNQTTDQQLMKLATNVYGGELYTVSKKTSPTFLAITRESIDKFL